MRINVSVTWDRAPAEGRFEFINATCLGGVINVGWGRYSEDDHKFSFTSATEPCRLCLGLEMQEATPATGPPTLVVVDTAQPFFITIPEVLEAEDGRMRLQDVAVTVRAEVDAWGNL